ncbi:MAG: hypothetical protein Q8N26_15505 [Myxococcales bacterium]|nr:hypothetical protein [Myxococcales bacterium]
MLTTDTRCFEASPGTALRLSGAAIAHVSPPTELTIPPPAPPPEPPPPPLPDSTPQAPALQESPASHATQRVP